MSYICVIHYGSHEQYVALKHLSVVNATEELKF